MIRHPPKSTLFPYTTLFRSDYDRGYPVTMNDPDKTEFMASVARAVAGENAVDTTVPPLMGAEDFSYMLEQRPGAYILDRKSTRLNSSHANISYAVFCLKKKK